MTVTIELSPEEELRLLAQARQQGQEIADRAHDLLRLSLGIPAAPQAEITEAKHAELIRRLQAAGLLTTLPTRRLGSPPKPITVLGPPVSETLVEDREPH